MTKATLLQYSVYTDRAWLGQAVLL